MSCILSINNLSITGDCSNTGSGGFTIQVYSTTASVTANWNTPPYPFEAFTLIAPNTFELTKTNLSPGNYSFTIQDSCLDPETGNLTILQNLTISSGTCVSINAVQNTTCGFNNGAITASTTYSYNTNTKFYLYETTSGYITSASSFNNITTDFDSLSPGVYYVIGDDGGGCTGMSESCVVKSSTTFDYDFYIVSNAACLPTLDAGAIYITNLNGTPPYTYSWNTTPVQTTSYITGLTTGVYQATVTDASGCVLTKSADVGAVPPLGLGQVYTTSPSCFSNDGQVQIVITGGTPPYYYSGSNGSTAVSFSPNHLFTNVGPGPFQISVTDAGLCNIIAAATLTNPQGFSTAVITTENSTCTNNDGIIFIQVYNLTSALVIYTLTDSQNVITTSNVTSSASWDFTGLESDTYTLTISGGSCVFTTTVTINNNALINTDYNVTGTTCGLNNGIIELIVSGGTGPYSYNITGQPGITNSSFSSQTFTNLASGNYIATISDQSINCASIENIFVPSSQNVNVSTFSTNPSAYSNNGSISAFITNGTPPFTWTWSSNVNGQTGLTVNNLSGGTYTFTAVDSQGCTINRTIVLNGYTPLSSFQLYNICDSVFQNTGILLTKGPKQMLNEGFYDLTSGDTNCILNEAFFTAVVNVGGIIKSSQFYTGTTLNDYPSDEEFSEVLEELLLSFDGITGVTINIDNNSVKITTPCNTLSGSNVKIDMLISYDISCQLIEGITPTPTPTLTPTPTPTLTPTMTPTPTPTPISSCPLTYIGYQIYNLEGNDLLFNFFITGSTTTSCATGDPFYGGNCPLANVDYKINLGPLVQTTSYIWGYSIPYIFDCSTVVINGTVDISGYTTGQTITIDFYITCPGTPPLSFTESVMYTIP